MMKLFEKEYFIKAGDGSKIECLHTLRAIILTEIINGLALISESELMLLTLQSVDVNVELMIIEFAYIHGITDELLNEIAEIKYNTWNVYSGVLKAMLWYDVRRYYLAYKEIIAEGDLVYNGSFAMFGINDVTGLLEKNIDMSILFDIVNENDPARAKSMKEYSDRFKNLNLDYKFTDCFLLKTASILPTVDLSDILELSPAGFALFWLSNRKIQIDEPNCPMTCKLSSENYNQYLDFIVGVQSQRWNIVYEKMMPLISEYLIKKFDIIYLDDSNDELNVKYICNSFRENYNFNQKIMSVVDPLRKLYLYKTKYNVEQIGHRINENIEIPDTQKHIPNENLPLHWITSLNGWLMRMYDYEKLPNTWEDVITEVITSREKIIVAKNIAQQDKFKLPKSATDKYGILLSNAVVADNSNSFSLQPNQDDTMPFKEKFNKYTSAMLNYYNSFLLSDNLVIQKIKKSKPSDSSRLSTINLVDALESLSDMQLEFEKLTSEMGINFEQNKAEIDTLEMLVNIWSNLYRTFFVKSRDIIFQRNNAKKQFLDRLDNLFVLELQSMDGVILYHKTDHEISLVVNDDSVIEKLFLRFKKSFPKTQTLTYEAYLFKKYLKTINVKYQVLDKVIPAIAVLDSNNFIIFDDYFKFSQCFMPEQSDQFQEDKSVEISASRCFGNINSLIVINNHCRDVIDNIDLSDETHLLADIWNDWVEIIEKNAILKTFSQLNDDLQYVFSFIPPDFSEEVKEAIHHLVKLIQDIINEPKMVINIKKEEMEQIVSKLNSSILRLFDCVDIQP